MLYSKSSFLGLRLQIKMYDENVTFLVHFHFSSIFQFCVNFKVICITNHMKDGVAQICAHPRLVGCSGGYTLPCPSLVT